MWAISLLSVLVLTAVAAFLPFLYSKWKGVIFEHLQFGLQLIIRDYYVTCHCSVAYRITTRLKLALSLSLHQSTWTVLLGLKGKKGNIHHLSVLQK